MNTNMTGLRWFSKLFGSLDEGNLIIGRQGSTLRKNFISPAGLVTETFTSPEIFLLALIFMMSNSSQTVTSVDIIASVDNMKRIQCIVVN